MAALVRAVFIALATPILAAGCAAGGDGSSPIVTDRPAVTASSVVVPVGSIQFENGFTDTVSQGQRTLDGPETLLRFGVASKTELRFVAPNYFAPEGTGSGFGDLAIGMKRQLGPIDGFDASLILSLSFPTGAQAISSHGYDPSVQLPWSHSLSKNWTAAGMLSAYWPTQEGRHKITGEATFLIDRLLTKTSDAFVEYAGSFPEAGGPRHLLHFGASWRVTPHQQIDVHAGVGLSSSAADHLIGIGYSFLFQAFRR